MFLCVFDKGRLVSWLLIAWRFNRGLGLAVKRGRSGGGGCGGGRGGL